MRTAKVFYLLLSVLQFIFFLKLVEYVRGEEIQKPLVSHFLPEAPDQEEYRGLFMAPNMQQKKLRKWNATKSQTANLSSTPTKTDNKDGEAELNGNNQKISKREQYEHEIARLCPACENNQCTSVTPISGGFQVVPVILAVLVGIGWFILFLIAWIFHTRPNTKGQESDGYGGYGSSESGYGDESDKPSIFDHFLKPHERSLQSYTRLLHNVLDSIGKFSDLYNSS